MPKPLDPMRIIRWASGAVVPSDLPLKDATPADPGIFGPGSVTWRLHTEQWLIAAGARAFLMQAAHPVVAQGALDHSRFAEDPYGRVYNTVSAMTVLIFGSTKEANGMAQRINRLHHTVTGTVAETVGIHRAGAPYSAMDAPALLWVHAAFVDSILSAYQSFVGPLGDADKEAYWQESLRYARRLGLTEADLPPSYPALQSYIRRAIATGEVAVGPGARSISRTILYPPMPVWRRPLWAIVQSMTIGQLPASLRRQYGIRWNRRDRALFFCVRYSARILRFLLPQYLGRSMAADFAERRVRAELAPAPSTPSATTPTAAGPTGETAQPPRPAPTSSR